MQVVEKVYGYITREHKGQKQVLVFEPNTQEVGVGIQIPKGTIAEHESPLEAIARGMFEETGLTDLVVQDLIAMDYFDHYSGVLQKRYFYHLKTKELRDSWQHDPIRSNENNVQISFSWINDTQDVLLTKGHGDYLYRVISKVKNS